MLQVIKSEILNFFEKNHKDLFEEIINHFKISIKNPDNDLFDELRDHYCLESLSWQNYSIEYEVYQDDNYSIYVKIAIFDSDKMIGTYKHWKTEDGEIIDDFFTLFDY
jgi:hypothetical protein